MVEASKVEQESTFEITVNGVQIKVDVEKLLAKDVLETAKEHGAMPGEARGLSTPRARKTLQARRLGQLRRG